jgi:ferritin-like metal-binding protein YciE
VNDEQLAEVLREHLRETEDHVRSRLKRRTPAHQSSRTPRRRVSRRSAARCQAPLTTGKVAIQAFATGHPEIASRRSLHAVAQQADESETAAIAEQILKQEQAAAHKRERVLEHAALVGAPHVAT